MIKSRVFLLVFILVSIIGIIIFALTYEFESRREKIISLTKKENFEKLFNYLKKEKNLSEEELLFSSIAVCKYENFLTNTFSKEKNSSSKIKKLSEKTGLNIQIQSSGNSSIIRIDDKFLNKISRNSYFRSRAIIEKLSCSMKTNDPSENSILFSNLLENDILLVLKDFSELLVEYLKWNSLANLSSKDKEKTIDLIHYLATKQESGFKKKLLISSGTNINLRSGPGIENQVSEKISEGEILLLLNSDLRQDTIGSLSGRWLQVYILSSDFNAWIFSPFARETLPDSERVRKIQEITESSQNSITIDFNSWKKEEIPDFFKGKYIPAENYISSGEIGFVVTSNGSNKNKLCAKIMSKFKALEFSYIHLKGKDIIPIFELDLVDKNVSQPLYLVECDNEGILINKNKYVSAEENSKENYKLQLNNLEDEFYKASLLKNNEVAINRINSKKVDLNELDQNNLQWEICLYQSSKKSSSKAAIFKFKIY